jgi:SecD/SecF fusion protein
MLTEHTLCFMASRLIAMVMPALPGDVVTSARKQVSPNNEIGVSMSMSPEGTSDWRRITAQAAPTNDAVAIMLDDKIYSAPTVRNEISTGMSEISGGFDDREADDLANILKAGKLPAPTRIVEESVVGPTLGEAARKAGLLSLLIGFLSSYRFCNCLLRSRWMVCNYCSC